MSAITEPKLYESRAVSGDWSVLPGVLPVPGLGVLPVNAFVLKGREPMLVDTSIAAFGPAFLDTLGQVVDPADLRWIWISHADADHVGNLPAVLAAAPKARIATTFLGMGKMMMQGLPPERMHLLNPGDRLDLGDRVLTPVRPVYYDAPETLGFVDGRDDVLFAADSFGALLAAPVESAAALTPEALSDGMTAWARIDAPWLAGIDRARFAGTLAALARLDPGTVLSGHLPEARGMTARLTGILRDAFANADTGTPADPVSLETVAPSALAA
ncbi:MAG: MBL fold metallo-hydrolase [Azospirillaceae bacterium]